MYITLEFLIAANKFHCLIYKPSLVENIYICVMG